MKSPFEEYPHMLRRFFPLSKHSCDWCGHKFRWKGWTFEGGQFISFNGGPKTGNWFYFCKKCCPDKPTANFCANIFNKAIWDAAIEYFEGDRNIR